MIYLDTSVLVAYYCPEPISERAEAIIRGKKSIYISDLTEVEFISALSRKVRVKDLAGRDAAVIRSQFAAHLNEGIYRRTSLGPHHVQSARGFLSGLPTPVRTLDALHLAIAFTEHLHLITGDEVLARSAKALLIKATLVRSR